MSKLEKKQATPVSEAIMGWLKISGLSAGWNTHRIFEAWDKASGAERYTIKRFFRDGKLYITLNSSVVCSHLQMRKDTILAGINAILQEDGMLVRNCKTATAVKELIIK